MSAISQIEIYKPDGTPAITTTISDTSQRVRNIMAENYIQIDFVSPSYVDIPVGSSISYGGYRFVKTRRQMPTYNGAWQYSEQFDDADGFLRTRRIKYYGQDFQEMSFALTATLEDFAALIVKDVNKEREGAGFRQDWAIGTIDAALADTLKTISFSGDTLFDACTAIAQAFETEWYITKYYVSTGSGYEVIQLNFQKKDDGSDVLFEVGTGKILNAMNPQRGEDADYGTRFFVFGGTRNLTEEYKEVPAGSSVPNLYENRLHLPNNQAYIDAKNGQIVDSLAHNEVLEQYVTFDDIYPKNRDIITGVSSEIVEDEQGNQYRQYTIQADNCPFAGKGDIIDILGIKFETGELAGQEFEARLESEELPWNKRLIIVAQNLGTDGQVLYVPNEQLKPSVDDVFVLTGVKLPTSKVTDAENELLEKAEEYAKQHSSDTDVYECVSNNVFCYENPSAQGYDIGTRVKLANTSLFGVNGRSSRVQGVVFSLTKPYEITWQVGDNTKYSRFGNVNTTLAEVIYSQRIGVKDNSLLNLIGSEDYQSPSDNNIYTALAVYNHIYKKHDHRGRLIRPAVLCVPTLSPAQSGFSLDDGEVAMYVGNIGSYAETPSGGGVAEVYNLYYRKNGSLISTINLGTAEGTINVTIGWSDLTPDANHRFLTDTLISTWNAKQDAINDLSTIRTQAGEGHTAYGWGNHASVGYATEHYVDTEISALNLGTASQKDYTTSVAQNGTGLPTSGAVYSAIAAAVTSALHYRGISSVELTDGGTETAVIGGESLVPQAGDVVIYKGFEFLWENNVWNKLGDDTSYALKTIQIVGDGTYITGGGQLTQDHTLTLSSSVIASLGKADTAVQPAALADYLPLTAGSSKALTGDLFFDSTSANRHIYFKYANSGLASALRMSSSGTLILGGNQRTNAKSTTIYGSDLFVNFGSDSTPYSVVFSGGAVRPFNSTINLGDSNNNWNEVWGAKAHISSLLAIPTSAPSSGDIVSGEAYLYSSTGSYSQTPSGGVADVYPLTITKNGSAWLYYNPGTQAESINLAIPTKVSDLTNDTGFITASSIPSTYAWSAITNTPTTLSGYGITDAKIANGTITLGSNSITPLTSFTETDPVFSASAAAGITSTNISNWNTAYGWGNHASQGYLKSSDHKALTLKVGSTTIGSDYNSLAAKTYTITAQNITDAIGSTTYAPYNSNGYVPTTRKVNNKALSSDITLSLDDVADGSTRKLADYLPLTAGIDKALTGHLYFDATNAHEQICWKYGNNQGGVVALMATTGHLYLGYNQITKAKDTYIEGANTYISWNTSAATRQAVFAADYFRPSADDTLYLGHPSYRWKAVYAKEVFGKLGTSTESDATFTYRAVPSVAVGDVARVTKVKGKSIVWNQMILQGNFPSGSTWSGTRGSVSISDNTITFTGDTSTSSSKGFVGYGSPSTVIIGHKYYIAITLRGDVATTVRFAHALNSGNSLYSLMNISVTTSWTRTSAIWNNTDLAPAAFYPAIRWIDTTNNVSKSIYAKDYVLIDLTQMLGIGNEPSTPAEFEALYPLPYYSYNTGELVSNNAEALETRDASDNILDTLPLNLSKMANAANPKLKFNQCAKGYDSSDYAVLTYTSKSTDTTTEELVVTSSNSASAVKGVKLNNVTFVSGHKYYINANFTSGANVGLYQSNGGYVIRTTISGAGVIGTATSSVAYFGCRLPNGAASGASYRFKNMMCVDLTEMYGEGNEPTDPHIVEELVGVRSYTEGEYMPNYIFPKGMKGCGTASDEASGKKATRRFDIVDLGSLSWAYTSGQFISTGLVGLVKEPADGGVVPNIISTKYTATSYGSFGDKQMIIIFAGSSSHGRLYIKDSSYTDATTFAAAVVGTKLIFELATPIEYDLETAVPELIECDVLGTQRRLPEDTASSVQAPFHCDFQYGANPGEIVSDSAYRYLPLAGGTITGTLEAKGELVIPDHAPYQPEPNKHYLYVDDNGNYYQS